MSVRLVIRVRMAAAAGTLTAATRAPVAHATRETTVNIVSFVILDRTLSNFHW